MDTQINITEDELEEVLQLLLDHYGYDFTNYSHASLKRRISHFMDTMRINNIYDLKYNLTNHKSFFTQFLQFAYSLSSFCALIYMVLAFSISLPPSCMASTPSTLHHHL